MKIKVCIAIMLTIIFGVNVIAFANFENVIQKDSINLISENSNEFVYSGTTSGKLVSASQDRAKYRKNSMSIAILIICVIIIGYFLCKIIKYFIENNKYKKAVIEGKEISKPKVEIKLKYILLLFVVIDVLIWSIIVLMNLV